MSTKNKNPEPKIEPFPDEELIAPAIEIVRAAGFGLISDLQAKLKISYPRARALMEMLIIKRVVDRYPNKKTFRYKILELPPAPDAAEPAYSDRADAMRADQREELKAVLKEKFGTFLARVSAERDATLEACNLAREMGAQIELFTGHQKLLPAEFDYLQAAMTGSLPAELGGETKDAPIDFAKACLAVHQKFPEPVTNYAIAAPVLEHLLIQLQLLPKPVRAGAEGQPSSTGPLLEYLDVVIKAAQKSAALDKIIPVEKWEPFNRKSFITQGKPFDDLYQRALKLEQANGK